MYKDKNLTGHLCMFAACAAWGLMSPLGKDAMAHGISGLALVSFRAVGAALCFWLTSLLGRHKEDVAPRDLLMFFFAGMLAIVFNQCCFTIGLSLTSPVNASIVTTTLPIVTMILAALFLKEPVTNKKVLGIFCGAIGALLLILGNGHAAQKGNGNLTGDLLCLTAQCSFAVYLTIFKKLIQKYTVVTCMKWMFTYAAICIIPFSFQDITHLEWLSLEPNIWYGLSFILLGSTFVSYLLAPIGQRYLRPTVVSMYCYVQPIVASCVAVYWGMDSFNLLKIIAVICVFSGVFLVTRSKSRADMEAAV